MLRFLHHLFSHSTFDVGRSTCPQCLDGEVSRIQPFDLYIDVNTHQMHYAWQAGVRCSFFSAKSPQFPAVKIA
jgi:hypothetical protein